MRLQYPIAVSTRSQQHASPAAAALLALVHSVVRPLGIPVHLNQIYANEVSVSAKYGLCRKGDCGGTFSTSNRVQIN